MKLSTEALNLLRDYRDVVEPEALMFGQSVMQGATVGALCPVYGTQRPDEPLLRALAHGGKLYWKPQLIESYIPCPGWYSRFNGHPLRAQLVAELLKHLPPVTDKFGQRLLTRSAPDQMDLDLYVDLTVMTYLALLIGLGYAHKDLAFSLAVNLLDMRLDPARAIHYYGCYLYNFKLDDPNIASIKLADGTPVQASNS